MTLDLTAIDLLCDGKHVCLDMHDIDNKLLKTKVDVLLLLRNLDINPSIAELDFSKCLYEDKADWLRAYAAADEKVEILALAKAWSDIVHAMLSLQMSDVKCGLLDEEELKLFVKDNIALCTDVALLLHDAMEWIAAIAADKQDAYIATEDKTMSANILFCCKYIADFDFELHSAFKTCKAWPTVLIPENAEQMKDMLQKSKCCTLLYGRHTPQWSAFNQLMHSLLNADTHR